MVPQRVNSYAGHGQAAPGAGTSTTLGEPTSAIEANIHDEVEAVVFLSDDEAVSAKSVSFQFYGKATADGADFTSWTAVGDPVVVALGTDALVRAVASALKHTRDFAFRYANVEATITHSDAGANTVTAEAALVGISQTVDPISARS